MILRISVLLNLLFFSVFTRTWVIFFVNETLTTEPGKFTKTVLMVDQRLCFVDKIHRFRTVRFRGLGIRAH